MMRTMRSLLIAMLTAWRTCTLSNGVICGVHGDVAGLRAGRRRRSCPSSSAIVLHLQEFGRRDAVAGDVDLALLQAQQRHQRLLADLEGDLVEIRHALVKVVGVALEDEALAERPFGQLEGAGADRLLAEVGAVARPLPSARQRRS